MTLLQSGIRSIQLMNHSFPYRFLIRIPYSLTDLSVGPTYILLLVLSALLSDYICSNHQLELTQSGIRSIQLMNHSFPYLSLIRIPYSLTDLSVGPTYILLLDLSALLSDSICTNNQLELTQSDIRSIQLMNHSFPYLSLIRIPYRLTD